MPDHRSGVARADHDRGVRAMRVRCSLSVACAGGLRAADARGVRSSKRRANSRSRAAQPPTRSPRAAFGASCDKTIGLIMCARRGGLCHLVVERAAAARLRRRVHRGQRDACAAISGSLGAAGCLNHHRAAPEWSACSRPGQTTLDQLTYEDVRARDLPMLCHFSGTARQTCVFWEPAAGGAGHFIDRDICEETNL